MRLADAVAVVVGFFGVVTICYCSQLCMLLWAESAMRHLGAVLEQTMWRLGCAIKFTNTLAYNQAFHKSAGYISVSQISR